MWLARVLIACSSCLSASLLEEMTLEEKAGQLLMVYFYGEEANEQARTLIQETNVGGIIYYNWSNGLYSPSQVKGLSLGLQEMASRNRHPIPLLIAVDQEGGSVTRLTNGFTVSPGNRALAEIEDPQAVETYAFTMGQELKAVGINLNLAPVVDVDSNPKNPVIGPRSYSDSAERVAFFGHQAILGYQRAGIFTCLKHFPGHGDVEVDSHVDLPMVNKSRTELDLVELLPFSTLACQSDAVMTAHLMVPAIDSTYCATLSKKVLDILRNEIGFDGVIISDCLNMEGLLKNCSPVEEAAVLAINAGCDLLIFGDKKLVRVDGEDREVADNRVERTHQKLVEAVKEGRISEERLNEAVARILKLKAKYQMKPFLVSRIDL